MLMDFDFNFETYVTIFTVLFYSLFKKNEQFRQHISLIVEKRSNTLIFLPVILFIIVTKNQKSWNIFDIFQGKENIRIYYETGKYNNLRFVWFVKKIQYRKNLLMATDIQITQSGALSLIWKPQDQVFLPFYPPVDK